MSSAPHGATEVQFLGKFRCWSSATDVSAADAVPWDVYRTSNAAGPAVANAALPHAADAGPTDANAGEDGSRNLQLPMLAW